MGEAGTDEARRIAIELDRLDQEVRVMQRVLEEAGLSGGADELAQRLRYMATQAQRLADRVEKSATASATA